MAKKKRKLLKGLRGPSYFIGGIIAGFGAKKRAKEGEAQARKDMAAAAAQREAEKANRQKLDLSPEVEKLKEGLGGDEIQRRQEAAERMRAGATAAATRGGSRVDPFAAAQAGSQAEGALATEQATAQRTGLQQAQVERADLRRTQEARSIADIGQAETERLEGRTDVMSAQKSAEAARQQIAGGFDAGVGMLTGNLFGRKGAVVRKGLKDRMKERENQVPRDEAEVTPGEFSHEENPIDLVQRDGNGEGEKIGEMTGGEAIVPPKNVKEIRHLIEDKDGDGLVELMDNLLTKWDKEAEENNRRQAEEESEARHGAVHKPRLPRFKKRSSIIS